VPVATLVRVLEVADKHIAGLQVDTGSGHWVTLSALYDVHAGDSVKIAINGGATANITATLVEATAFVQPSFELAAFGPGAGSWSSDNTYPRELADVNGDGMADIVGFGQARAYLTMISSCRS
jgi:hypothetical protein